MAIRIRSLSWKWTRVGLDPDVYAEVKKYTLDCKTGGYSADSVTFYYSRYLDKPQMGRVTDKILNEKDNIPNNKIDPNKKE